ncbi:hypothetical protein Pmar_PMAR026705 [Perkinsus marinus ATCC 50983]|uniref:Rhodanese domain-containing protein n=1 Tax=Perkinsus marinus (strain ATCC 50983 / TXsc) TaxID=423536 RepID=C5K5V4_PERM5|nr:hypothetical protein Pmar_PMAR026705 [Perkinsus marinus ATCC 50983]EER20115.1 hypothetical protein Pmar_PMAR026705 [Perkinsus marinus ATCC 50983]|eukprot:XP_002788319.1 hypothetical protein Pmar_PMAR026705 [Perkinsus marinus ATCC 50983]
MPLFVAAFLVLFALLGATDKIKVFPDMFYSNVDNKNIYLCPPETISEETRNDWKAGTEVLIDGSQCEDYDHFLAEDGQGDFLDCVVWIEGKTIAALDKLGVDAYLMSGSLLGWYRHHKGVVPWDVDGDLGMNQDTCNAAFEAKGGKHKNMIGLLRETIGEEFYVGARLQGIGSSLPEDSFEACDTNELMVRGSHPNGKTCHTDIWIMHPDDAKYKGTEFECQCKSDIPMPRVCRKKTYCNALDDFLPVLKTTQSAVSISADVKVPRKPKEVLDILYSKTDFLNMNTIPGNYKFGSRVLVLGSDASESATTFLAPSTPQFATDSADLSSKYFPEVSIVVVVGAFVLGSIVGGLIHRCYVRRHSPTIAYTTVDNVASSS